MPGRAQRPDTETGREDGGGDRRTSGRRVVSVVADVVIMSQTSRCLARAQRSEHYGADVIVTGDGGGGRYGCTVPACD